MSYRTLTRFVSARDGTRIAWHTHLPRERLSDGEDVLAARPTIVLTNGIGTSANFWRHIVHTFGHDHRVVHWDFRGHGRSEVAAASGDYSIATQGDDLARVTDAVMSHGTTRQPPLHVGFSMGVTVVLEMYRRRPELARAMALIAGPPDAPFSTSLPMRIPGVRPAIRGALAAMAPLVPIVAPAVRRVLSSPIVYPAGRALGLLRRRAPREDINELMKALCAMDPGAFWQTLRCLMEARSSDVLPTVKCPVLIVAATNDLLVPVRDMTDMSQRIAGSHWVVLDDAGHAGLLEAGPEVAANLRLFVRRTDRRAANDSSPLRSAGNG